ncbi:diaminopimelate epimerase [bacterium]|nr:diaminopimelate epimerase [bacterium]
MPFIKMHGCGNDFIVFDDPRGEYGWTALSQMAQRFCDRRFGIGGDGIIAVGHGPVDGEVWGEGAQYEMRYVNADGSRAEMCGNGIRCTGKFIADELGFSGDELLIQTGNGVLPIRLMREGGAVSQVSVGMGVPRLAAEQVPMQLDAATTAEAQAGGLHAAPALLELPIDGAGYRITGVSMGNPHAVIFVPEISDHHVHSIGPRIETDPHFPKKTNVEFNQVLSPTHLRMRVWERGCGETWACGTGACASAVAAVLAGHSPAGQDITLSLNGGDLSINWPGPGQPVQMTGPAESVFRGELSF